MDGRYAPDQYKDRERAHRLNRELLARIARAELLTPQTERDPSRSRRTSQRSRPVQSNGQNYRVGNAVFFLDRRGRSISWVSPRRYPNKGFERIEPDESWFRKCNIYIVSYAYRCRFPSTLEYDLLPEFGEDNYVRVPSVTSSKLMLVKYKPGDQVFVRTHQRDSTGHAQPRRHGSRHSHYHYEGYYATVGLAWVDRFERRYLVRNDRTGQCYEPVEDDIVLLHAASHSSSATHRTRKRRSPSRHRSARSEMHKEPFELPLATSKTKAERLMTKLARIDAVDDQPENSKPRQRELRRKPKLNQPANDSANIIIPKLYPGTRQMPVTPPSTMETPDGKRRSGSSGSMTLTPELGSTYFYDSTKNYTSTTKQQQIPRTSKSGYIKKVTEPRSQSRKRARTRRKEEMRGPTTVHHDKSNATGMATGNSMRTGTTSAKRTVGGGRSRSRSSSKSKVRTRKSKTNTKTKARKCSLRSLFDNWICGRS